MGTRASLFVCTTTIFIRKSQHPCRQGNPRLESSDSGKKPVRYIECAPREYRPLRQQNPKGHHQGLDGFYTASQGRVASLSPGKIPRRRKKMRNLSDSNKARSFDIMAGFCPPAFAPTGSWHTNLAKTWDKLAIMRHHPLPEARAIAEQILSNLKEKYPHSFSHPENAEHEKYRAAFAAEYTYFQPEKAPDFSLETNVNREELRRYKKSSTPAD
jgi:hypothetical protein